MTEEAEAPVEAANVHPLDEEASANTEEGSEELSVQDIYHQLVLEEEIILTMYDTEAEELRSGLIQVKAKEVAKLKEQGIAPDNLTLKFTKNPVKDRPEIVKLHIALTKKKTFSILSITKPEDTI
jgi:hypothetical protein